MKILIVYATNTGNTYLAAQIIRDMLSHYHKVTLTNANDTPPNIIDDYDLILLGSSSWDWQGKEGHPIQSMINYLESLNTTKIQGQKFVVFGCGDTDFKLFCGAVDKITDFISATGGQIVSEPLKIDKFYTDVLHKVEQVKAWANSLNAQLSTD